MFPEFQQQDSKSGSEGRNPDRVMRKSVQQGQIFIWATLVVLLVVYFTGDFGEREGNRLTYSEFLSAVDEGKIAEVTLRGQELEGHLTEKGSRPTTNSR